MATPTDPQTIINTQSDPALAKDYPNTFQNFPTLTGNTSVYVTNQYITENISTIVTDQAAGASGELQYNSGNKLAADSGLTYNAVTDSLNVGGTLTANAIVTSLLLQANGTPYSFSGNGIVGGTSGQLQYNNSGTFAGIANTSYSSGNLALGNIANIKITGGSETQFIATDGAGNLRFTDSYTLIAGEFHVSVSGDDVNHDGSMSQPYRTITKALTQVASQGKVVVHPGTYTENPTITTTNISLVAAQADSGASPAIDGTLTISGTVNSIKLQGITTNILNVSTSGNVYATQIKVANAVNKTGNSYTEFTDSDLIVSGGNVTITGGNATNVSTTVFVNTKLANVRATNQYSTIFYKDSTFVSNTVMTAGSLIADGTFFYAPTNGGNAITTSGTTSVSLRSSSVFNPNLTIGKVNLTSSTYAVSDLIYDKANSILGTSAYQISDFQNIRAQDVTVDTIVVSEDASVTGNLEVTGNISTAKVTATGNISTSANASVTGNLTVSGLATITGNITTANVNTGIVAATGNISGSNLTLTTNASVNGNLTAGNIGTGILNASGNLSAANVSTGIVAATGNISGVNFTASANITATGNITGANLSTGGAITATGNISSGNISTGIVNATGNVSGSNLVMNGNGNISGNATVGGTLAVSGNVSTANLTITGLISATGNISSANISAAGLIAATGNITGANLVTAGVVAASGNVSGVSFNASGVVIATGSITGGNLITSGLLTVTGVGNITGNINGSANATITGNIAGGNISTTGLLTASGSITGGNLITTGLLNVTGNITGGNLITNGLLNVTGNITGGNITTGGNVTANGTITSTANITGANIVTTGTGFLTTANVTNLNLTGVANLAALALTGTSRASNTTAVVGNLVTITLNGTTYQLMAV
jgi:hypothetical protein